MRTIVLTPDEMLRRIARFKKLKPLSGQTDASVPRTAHAQASMRSSGSRLARNPGWDRFARS